jgi:hypothetical protein
LVRLEVGPFSLSEACDPEDFDPERHLRSPETFVGDLPGVSSWAVSQEAAARIVRGGTVGETDFIAGAPVPGDGVLTGAHGEALALGSWDGQRFRYQIVFAAER